MRQPHLTAKLQGFGTTIFAEMTALAVAYDAVNLGQGFPDFDPPAEMTEVAVEAIRSGHNQYAPGPGIPQLRQAIAAHQHRFHGMNYDADHEVTVTAGATEAVAAAILALCETGDEVAVFEPAYDSYLANIAMAGATPRVVALRPPAFDFALEDLDQALGPRTRVLLLNSPHNPTGRVFGEEELRVIAAWCVERDVLVVADEVYEHLVFTGAHRSIATFPGMRERTIVVSSAGKTFSVTGWKIGWACAPPALTTALRTAKQFMTFTNGTPFQYAVAHALSFPDHYFDDLVNAYRRRRDLLTDALAEAGFGVSPPEGTYFVTTDIRPLGYENGAEFCRMLPAKVGVVAIPESVFCTDPRRARSLVRFAFCKTDAVLEEGIRRLATLRPAMGA